MDSHDLLVRRQEGYQQGRDVPADALRRHIEFHANAAAKRMWNSDPSTRQEGV